jgi:hypothetical protein
MIGSEGVAMQRGGSSTDEEGAADVVMAPSEHGSVWGALSSG